MNKATIYLYQRLDRFGNPQKYKWNYPEQNIDKFRKLLKNTPFVEAQHPDGSVTFIY